MRTLLSRLCVSHLLVALGSLVLLLWLSPQLFLHYYLAAEEQRLSAAVLGLARVAERLSGSPASRGDLALLVRTSGAMLGGEVALLGPDGRSVLVASHTEPAGAGWAVDAWQSRRLPVGADIAVAHDQPNAVVFVHPLGTPERPSGAVVVRRRAPELQTLLRAHRLMTAASAGLAMVLAVLLSLVVSRAIAKPLVTMSHAAERMAAENFSVAVPERGPRELASLASSLNRMAAALAAAFAALSAERQRLADVLATMSEGVVGLDGAGCVTIANRSAGELLGCDLSPGTCLDTVLPEAWAARVAAALANDPGSAFTVERGDQSLNLNLSPALDGGAVLVIADVTSARRLDLMRREFVASVSHELRAPLTAIRGFLGALVDGTAEGAAERDHCVQVADREAARMARLVEELLELSRLQAGVMLFEFQPTRLDEVIEAVAQSLAPRLAEREVRLVRGLPPGCPEVEADGDRLAQVFVNLLDNALRFSPPGGQTTITVRQQAQAETTGPGVPPPGAVVCSVSDEGPGIAEEDLQRIWDRFYKSDRARPRTEPGAGLGLAIVREIVHAHGGEVFAQNRPAGGAEIGFWLPTPKGAV
jgi:two-component system, OmpR family, sensor histidine kinase VicK